MTKEELWGVRTIDLEIEGLCEKYEALGLSLLPSGIRYDKDKVQTSPEDKLSEIVAQRMELDELIKAKRVKRAEMINELYDEIEKIEEPKAQVILIKYFIAGKSMRNIADEMGISKSAVHKIYKNILIYSQKVDKVDTGM